MGAQSLQREIGTFLRLTNFPEDQHLTPRCAAETTFPDFEAGEIIASCSDRHRVCRATMLSGTKNEVLSVRRKTGTDEWEIRLGSYQFELDHSRGIDYAVDAGKDQHVPAEFLTPLKSVGLERSNEVNRLLVDKKLAKVVLQDILKGKKVTWTYQTSGGGSGAALFSSQGLDKIMEWIACKQPK